MTTLTLPLSLSRIVMGIFLLLHLPIKISSLQGYQDLLRIFQPYRPEWFDSVLWEQVHLGHWIVLGLYAASVLLFLFGKHLIYSIPSLVLLHLFFLHHHSTLLTPQDLLLFQFLIWHYLFVLNGMTQTPYQHWNDQQRWVALGALLHLVMIYWNAVILKTLDPLWATGEGAVTFIRLYAFEGNLASWLQGFPIQRLQQMNTAIIVLEFVLPALALLSVKKPKLRLWVVCCMIGFHTMNAFIFGYVTMAVVFTSIWLMFFPYCFSAHGSPKELPVIQNIWGWRAFCVWGVLIGVGFVFSYLPTSLNTYVAPLEKGWRAFKVHQRWSFASKLNGFEKEATYYNFYVTSLEESSTNQTYALISHDLHQKPHYLKKADLASYPIFWLTHAMDEWFESDLDMDASWSNTANLTCDWLNRNEYQHLQVEIVEITQDLKQVYPQGIEASSLLTFECL